MSFSAGRSFRISELSELHRTLPGGMTKAATRRTWCRSRLELDLLLFATVDVDQNYDQGCPKKAQAVFFCADAARSFAAPFSQAPELQLFPSSCLQLLKKGSGILWTPIRNRHSKPNLTPGDLP